jgi:hypothetical protein
MPTTFVVWIQLENWGGNRSRYESLQKALNCEMRGDLFTRTIEQDGELRELPPDQYVVNTGQEIDVVLDAAGKAVEKQMPGSRYSLVAMPSAKPLHLRQRRGRFLEGLGPDMGWKPRICQNTLRYGPFASS